MPKWDSELKLMLASVVAHVDQLVAEYRDTATGVGRKDQIRAEMRDLHHVLVDILKENDARR